MSTRWENVVGLARELDAAIASGKAVDDEIVARLARAVLEFQKDLTGPGSTIPRPPPKS
jgi:hypothetical protein